MVTLKYERDKSEWLRIITASVEVRDPADIEKIADICVRDNCNAWHGAATYYEVLDKCPCAPCRKQRGKG